MTTDPFRWLEWAKSHRLGGRWWLEWTPRGDSLDPLRQRWRTWQVVGATLLTWAFWRRHPFGRRPLGKDLRRYITATGARVQADHAMNEPLEVIYEYGVVGVVGLSLLVALLVGGMGRSPDFGPSLAVWALTMMGSLTLRTWPFPLVGALLLLGAWA